MSDGLRAFANAPLPPGGNCPLLNDTRTPNTTPLIINLNIDGHPRMPIFSELPLFSMDASILSRYIVKNRAYKSEVPYLSTKLQAISSNYAWQCFGRLINFAIIMYLIIVLCPSSISLAFYRNRQQ